MGSLGLDVVHHGPGSYQASLSGMDRCQISVEVGLYRLRQGRLGLLVEGHYYYSRPAAHSMMPVLEDLKLRSSPDSSGSLTGSMQGSFTRSTSSPCSAAYHSLCFLLSNRVSLLGGHRLCSKTLRYLVLFEISLVI